MSDKKMRLRIVTPDKVVFDGQVDAVGAMGSEGAFTALPGHVPFLTDLNPGLLWFRNSEGVKDLAVSGGFAEILPNKTSVLADSAEYLEEIDVARAEKALKRAEERLRMAKAEARLAEDGQAPDISRATLSMTRAATRIKLATRRIHH
jgi:F-type H+-transporting ATPase subunit epsilon